MNSWSLRSFFLGLILTSLLHSFGWADISGVAGCMATACHGSHVASAPMWQQAGKIWFDHDPHAQAYSSLLTESSANIVSRLVNRRLDVSTPEYRDILEAKCVSCHATESESVQHRVLGADCQVCHGKADAWGSEHYSNRWRDRGMSRFDAPGMLNMESIVSRVAVCTSCHVGELQRNGLDREVDHRLMAAGHPTMHFDFETFMRRYPAHWQSNKEPIQPGTTTGLERWSIGKIATAEMRLKLLIARADRVANHSDRKPDWPELSEYSCYSCHRALGPTQIRPSKELGSTMQWDQWTLSQLELALHLDSNSQYKSLLRNLKSEVEQSTPNAQSVSLSADALRQWLSDELRRKPTGDEFQTTGIAKSLRSQLASSDAFASWESATQWYIATRIQCEAIGIDSASMTSTMPNETDYRNFWKPWNPNRKIAFPPPSPHQVEVLERFRTDLLKQLRTKP